MADDVIGRGDVWGGSVGAALGALLSGAGWADPYPVYEAIRAHGPLVRVQERFYVASSYQAAHEVLREPRMLVPDHELAALQIAPDDALDGTLLHSNPPGHTRVRRLAAATFTPRLIEAMHTAVTEQAGILTRYLAHLGKRGEVFDFATEFGYPLPVRVLAALLGVPTGDLHWFREQAQALAPALEPTLTAAELDAAVRARSRLGLYFADLIGSRRDAPADDLVTALVSVRDADGDRLTRDEIVATLVLLVAAGFEATANLLTNGLAVLLERPDLSAALRADQAWAPSFVEEVLRFDPPVQLTARWCREPVPVAGMMIEPYSQVLVLLAAANRDPARYPHPAQFDPARQGSAPLSFGAGAHYCLGAQLASMQAQVAFPLLVTALPRLALAGPPLRRPRLSLRGYSELPLIA